MTLRNYHLLPAILSSSVLTSSFTFIPSLRNPTRPLLSQPRNTLHQTSSSSGEDGTNATDEFKSVAMEWAEAQGLTSSSSSSSSSSAAKNPKYVVIGGGWAGWGAAKTLCQSGTNAEVILIDALPDPTGATPYLSPSGKPVEAGTRGFWKDYPNINALCAELSLSESDIFTPFTNSSFYSPDGLEATAPVFSSPDTLSSLLPSFIPKSILPDQLPSPLGQVIATFPLFERLPIPDRVSMAGLLLATIDCLGAKDEEVLKAYDRMTAHELFIRFGLSDRLVRDFVKPTLLVGLFKPPEELSALVVMELLYYYALAHQDSFDVRWIKNGTVSDSLIAPLAASLTEGDDGLDVRGGCRVTSVGVEDSTVATSPSRATTVTYTDRQGTSVTIDDLDGVILALGPNGFGPVVRGSPSLARYPAFSGPASLKGIDVISTRIWLDRIVPTRTPANVFSRFEALRGAGGTFFMLDQLQEGEGLEDLWAGEEVQGSVVACDFYNGGGLMGLSDEDIVKILMEELLPSAVPKFADAKVVDSWVGKYPGTVSWFSPGSYPLRPPLEGAGVNTLPNIKCAGDWVRMGEKEHGAKGLCQERAYVSGMHAANSLMRDTIADGRFKEAQVLEIREDEKQFQWGVGVNNQVMKYLPRFWVR